MRLGESVTRGGDRPLERLRIGRPPKLRFASASARLGQAALGYGGMFHWMRAGDDERLVPLLERALAALDPGDSALRAAASAGWLGRSGMNGAWSAGPP